MAAELQLTRPWLVAVWPGMGHVAVNAGVYLLSKLDMHVVAEFEADGLFDVDQVEVKNGIIQAGRHPRNRLFAWKDPRQKHDLVVFLGEAQPPIGKYAFCRRLLEHVRTLGVERVFTFAAMATQMYPTHGSRVFAAATNPEGLQELKRLELASLEDGHIGGLNGILLGAAKEMQMHGACLLGEIPHVLSAVPFPKASLAILAVFITLADVQLDFAELKDQARVMEEHLTRMLSRVEAARAEAPEEESFVSEAQEEDKLGPAARTRIEEFFTLAEQDRTKAFELKQELDRLGVFKEYEDRFLDLFKQSGSP